MTPPTLTPSQLALLADVCLHGFLVTSATKPAPRLRHAVRTDSPPCNPADVRVLRDAGLLRLDVDRDIAHPSTAGRREAERHRRYYAAHCAACGHWDVPTSCPTVDPPATCGSGRTVGGKPCRAPFVELTLDGTAAVERFGAERAEEARVKAERAKRATAPTQAAPASSARETIGGRL